MIEAIIDWLMDNMNKKGIRKRIAPKFKVFPIKINYSYIPIINKKLLLQNQRRY